ncbi:DUF5666 domain-containing protein [Aquabacterium sp. OR-4]|uniref:DUF5666 domain-containing protein n=1 Tax=Aquabacterium sp. OR-4 TaxID=2978127 RepID=UPI0028C6AB50|nr:DUF5666 domain-containing protein [Aquabacterium sp. OR-4]MDT7836800.1 DUF5666 domain-containing protein [Aquabacterium sp. OR-4]
MNAHDSTLRPEARRAWSGRLRARLATLSRSALREGATDVLAFGVALLAAALAALLLGSLHGCGGGVGIEGTGSSYASGPITGYGSIIVNGVHFDEGTASVSDDDGLPLERSQLALGMVVQVQAGAITATADGTQVATASSVRTSRTLVGPPQVSAGGQLSVLGQVVSIGSATVLDASFTRGLASIAQAGVIEVYGDYDSTSASVLATRIAPAAAGSSYSVRGPVSAIDFARQTCTIGSQTYSLSSTSGLSDGTVVKLALQGSIDGNGRWQTSGQKTDSSLPGRSGAVVELQGLVSSMSSATRFVVDGVTVDSSAATVSGSVQRGSRVEVKGTVQNNVLQASRVEVDSDSQARSFELRGTVASIDRATLSMVVQVAGRSTVVSLARSDLVFERGALADLAAGVGLRVTGQLAADGRVLEATRIRIGN